MKQVSENRIRLRIEYARETDKIFSDNIPQYADWLEERLAKLEAAKKLQSSCGCRRFIN